MNLDITYRPIGNDWPGKRTLNRQRSRFDTRWSQDNCLARAGTPAPGSPSLRLPDRRGGASDPAGRPAEGERHADGSGYHPELRVDLRYSCDRFTYWQDNVRAIALGLEALRTVDRYGITRKGEQYTGWKALPPAGGTVLHFDRPEQAAEWMLRFIDAPVNSLNKEAMVDDPQYRKDIFKRCAMKAHPDKGGARADWDSLQRAMEVLGG